MDAENSERAGNNRDGGGGDSDTNNKEDLCLPSIEPFGSSQNLSSEADENTSLPLEKIAQTLSDDDFLDIDGFLRPVWEMPNPTLPTDDDLCRQRPYQRFVIPRSVRRRVSVQVSADVSIVVGTSDNSKRLDSDRRYRRGQNRH